MKVQLSVLAAALLITGCASKEEPATRTVAAAEAALADIRPEAAQYAPDELQSTEASLAVLKGNLAKEEYKDVLYGATKVNQDITRLRDIVVAKQTQVAAATNEWEDLSEEVPTLIDSIDQRVRWLASYPRLPQDVKKEDFETAKTELASMKSLWAEASAAFKAGDTLQAADKGREAQIKGHAVAEQLVM